jgi:hypothetical protein
MERHMSEKLPLLAIPAAAYNAIALFLAVTAQAVDVLVTPFVTIPMPAAEAGWQISLGDIVFFVGLICLFIEMVRSAGSSNATIYNHALSMVVFIICLVEFLLLPPFATSPFFLLTAMTLLDVVAGFIITTYAARKDIGYGG